MWLAAAVPLLLFALLSWSQYQRAIADAQLRVDRAARVGEEHALKVFETNVALLMRVADALGDDSDEQLRARERTLHDNLVRMTADLKQLQGLFVMDGAGRMLVNNRAFPAPAVNVSDRAFFRHHRAGGAQPFFTEVLTSRTTGEFFFDMSLRRNAADGRMTAVLSASMAPRYFADFYRELAGDGSALNLALRQADGALLAGWPQAPQPGDAPAGAGATATKPEPVVLDRIAAARSVGGTPLRIEAWIDRAAALAPWYRQLAMLAALGLPIALALMYMTWVALRRTQRALEVQRILGEETAQRQRIEETLRQAQKLEALGRLSGGVAHDFNNLLMIVGNNVYLLRRLQAALAENPQLAAIERAVAAGTKLTRQLLSFSRRQPLRLERVRLQEQLHNIVELAAPALGAAIVVEAQVAADTEAVEVDIAELELALLNLAINARDAMPDGGRLRVTAANAGVGEPAGLADDARAERRFVVVSVQDSGHGIAPDVLERVFEPFFTTKEASRGTGLGLAQVYGFCSRAGGMATIESVQGQGTVVRLYLPACASTEAPKAVRPDSDDATPRADLRVLLVEDNAEVAFGTATALESMGCRVHQAGSADAALEMLRADASRFDIVLSDIVMCGSLDGIGLAAIVRAEQPALPILLISGYSASLDNALALGVDVLPKPCTPAALSAAMRSAIARHGTARRSTA